MSASRCRFLLESISDLRARLRCRGSDLLIFQGHPEKIIPELAVHLAGGGYCNLDGEPSPTGGRMTTKCTLYAHTDVCSEEIDVHAAVKAALVPVLNDGSRADDTSGGSSDGYGEGRFTGEEAGGDKIGQDRKPFGSIRTGPQDADGPSLVVNELWGGSTLHCPSDFPFVFPEGVPAVFSHVRRTWRTGFTEFASTTPSSVLANDMNGRTFVVDIAPIF